MLTLIIQQRMYFISEGVHLSSICLCHFVWGLRIQLTCAVLHNPSLDLFWLPWIRNDKNISWASFSMNRFRPFSFRAVRGAGDWCFWAFSNGRWENAKPHHFNQSICIICCLPEGVTTQAPQPLHYSWNTMIIYCCVKLSLHPTTSAVKHIAINNNRLKCYWINLSTLMKWAVLGRELSNASFPPTEPAQLATA